MSADGCFKNKNNIIIAVILVLLHVGRKISYSCFFLFFIFFFLENVICGYYCYYNNIGYNNKNIYYFCYYHNHKSSS